MTTGVRAGFLLDPAAEAIYDEDAHAAADRRTEFRLEAEAEARGGLAPEDPADEATRAGAVNWTGALNEFLQHRYGLDVGSPVFREAYHTAGPAHGARHRCTLAVDSDDMGLHHEVKGAHCRTVKAAKKDACRAMLEWFRAREADASAPRTPPCVPSEDRASHLAVDAMLGDAVLKLVLVDYFVAERAKPGDARPGALQNFVVSKSTNDFLYRRHNEMSRRGQLPLGLPPPKGRSHADPTAFEAWIARTFRKEKKCLRKTAEIVLPALGIAASAAAATIAGEGKRPKPNGSGDAPNAANATEAVSKPEGAASAEEAKAEEESERPGERPGEAPPDPSPSAEGSASEATA